MDVDGFHLFQLAAQGFCCSQILLLLGLEAEGKDNPDLVRSMQGLCGGLGRSGGVCGAITGGVCLLSLKAGKGRAEETSSPKLNGMIHDFLQWFDAQYESRQCSAITETDLAGEGIYPVKCANIVTSTYSKVQEILARVMTETQAESEE